MSRFLGFNKKKFPFNNNIENDWQTGQPEYNIFDRVPMFYSLKGGEKWKVSFKLKYLLLVSH